MEQLTQRRTPEASTQTGTCVQSLLAEGLEACREREAQAFDRATTGTDGIVLFGAGGLGRKTLAALRAARIEPLAFADNNGSLWGSLVEGIPVLSPMEAAARYGQSAAFVITIWASWNDRIEGQVSNLESLGCRTVIPFAVLAWKYPESLLPHVQIDLPSRVHEQAEAVLNCSGLWADDESRREYAAQLRWRLYSDFAALGDPLPAAYWQPDLIRLGDNAVFVDAGAFDGDTIAQFVEFAGDRFGRAYAFEPDIRNFTRLQERLSQMPEATRSRISAHQQAVGNFDGPVSFSSGKGEGSSIGGEEFALCVTLDRAVSEPPSYIKYDVEGFEPEALAGSRRLIADCRPALAICVYHSQDHLWRLPLLVHSISSGYRFYLRPHGQVWETVCYAVPE
jgi:FkbM family methyltransferase